MQCKSSVCSELMAGEGRVKGPRDREAPSARPLSARRAEVTAVQGRLRPREGGNSGDPPPRARNWTTLATLGSVYDKASHAHAAARVSHPRDVPDRHGSGGSGRLLLVCC